jgi:hypothetical protein
MIIKEEEIRPQVVFDEYLRLTVKDIETYFSNVEREQINCPSCGCKGEVWVVKQKFTYEKCNQCQTIFVNPRPLKEAFDAYYTDSPSTEFWATTFYKVTESARREKLWKPKAQLVKSIIEEFQGKNLVQYIVDIGGGYGVFDEEIKKIMDINALIIEPSVHLAKICRDKGLEVSEKFLEDINDSDLPISKKCFVSFELFEHLHDPLIFMQSLEKVMLKGDLFIFTTLSGIGVDIQVLKEHSKSVSPPHHLNFFNPKSVCKLINDVGLEVLKAETPGKLDIDILKNNINKTGNSFWNSFLNYATEVEMQNMQDYLSSNNLSSHMMITCEKR